MSDVTYWQAAYPSVVKGTVTVAGTSAFITGIYQIFKKQPHYGQLAAATALNSGMTAVTFFSLREYIISPILIYTIPYTPYERQRKFLGLDTYGKASPDPTWTELRTQKVADSWLSGMLTGGGLRAMMAGRKAILPAALTSGIVCMALQLMYNEVQVMRVQWVGGQLRQDGAPLQPPKEEGTWFPRFLKLFGLTQFSDEEYLVRLKKQRDGYLAKMRELEEEIDATREK